jgi:hypothetical protein
MFYLLSSQCDSNIIIIFSPIPLQRPTQTELRDEVPFRGEDCHNSPFQVNFRTSTIYYSLVTIHRSLFIISLFIIFGVSLRFRETFKNFTIHVTLFISGGKTLFIFIVHFIVNLVYGVFKFA